VRGPDPVNSLGVKFINLFDVAEDLALPAAFDPFPVSVIFLRFLPMKLDPTLANGNRVKAVNYAIQADCGTGTNVIRKAGKFGFNWK
jgi:hypothetical protein